MFCQSVTISNNSQVCHNGDKLEKNNTFRETRLKINDQTWIISAYTTCLRSNPTYDVSTLKNSELLGNKINTKCLKE